MYYDRKKGAKMDQKDDKNIQVLRMPPRNSNDASQLLPTRDMQTITHAYQDLFTGLSATNWSQNMTLGAAWHKAIRQIDTMIGARDENNPAVQVVSQVHTIYRAHWAKESMTSPDKDKMMNLSPESMQKWKTENAARASAALGAINVIVTKHTTHDARDTVPAAPAQKIDIKRVIAALAARKKQTGR